MHFYTDINRLGPSIPVYDYNLSNTSTGCFIFDPFKYDDFTCFPRLRSSCLNVSVPNAKGVRVSTTATIKTNHGQQQLATGVEIHLCTWWSVAKTRAKCDNNGFECTSMAVWRRRGTEPNKGSSFKEEGSGEHLYICLSGGNRKLESPLQQDSPFNKKYK